LEGEVVTVANDKLEVAQEYFERHRLPFPGLVDEDHRVYDRYDVQSRMLSLGQRPALFILDKKGVVRFAHWGTQQWQIPPNEEVLAKLARIQGPEKDRPE
jgi:peroxiredoxin